MQKISLLLFFLVSFYSSYSLEIIPEIETQRAQICADAETLRSQLQEADKCYSEFNELSNKIHSHKTYYSAKGTPQKSIMGNNMSIDAVFMDKRRTLGGILRDIKQALKKHEYEKRSHFYKYTPLKNALGKVSDFFVIYTSFKEEAQKQVTKEQKERKKTTPSPWTMFVLKEAHSPPPRVVSRTNSLFFAES